LLRKIALLSSAALFASVGFIGSGAHAGNPVANVANDHVHCATSYGSIGIAPALTASTNGTGVYKIKGTLAGCVDSDNPAVQLATSTFSGTLTGPESLGALAGATPVTGTIKISWKTTKTSDKLSSSSTTLTPNGFMAGTPLSPNAEGQPVFQAGDVYATFIIGTGGANTASSTGAFSGGDSGHGTTLINVTSQDEGGALAGQLTTGIKAVTLGLGAADFG
jgi:hypothetical protein